MIDPHGLTIDLCVTMIELEMIGHRNKMTERSDCDAMIGPRGKSRMTEVRVAQTKGEIGTIDLRGEERKNHHHPGITVRGVTDQARGFDLGAAVKIGVEMENLTAGTETEIEESATEIDAKGIERQYRYNHDIGVRAKSY